MLKVERKLIAKSYLEKYHFWRNSRKLRIFRERVYKITGRDECLKN